MYIQIRDNNTQHFYIEFETLTAEYVQQAQVLNMDSNEYKQHLKDKFNGLNFKRKIYFLNKVDAEAAVEWINSIIIMEKLAGEDPDIKLRELEPYFIMEKLTG